MRVKTNRQIPLTILVNSYNDNSMDIKLKRYKNNPILVPTKHKWENKAVYNCGTTIIDGRVAILYRAQGDDMVSRFGLAFSDDGYHIAERLPEPVFVPDIDSEYEKMGVEDPRITKIDNTYYIVYTAASFYQDITGRGEEERQSGETPWRVRLSIAHTSDFKTFTKHGVVVTHIDSKDGLLFPEKFKNQFLLLHRVIPDIRLAVSENAIDFTERGPLLGPSRKGWDSFKVGAGAPPIKTPYGWVLIYHGVNREKADENRNYSIGLALIDKNNPLKVLTRSKNPILSPEETYEKVGLVNNVVFTCGAVVLNNELLVYYGAADSTIGVASINYDEIVAWAKHYSKLSK